MDQGNPFENYDWVAALGWQQPQNQPRPQHQYQYQHQHQQQAYASEQGVPYQTRGNVAPYGLVDTAPADLGSIDDFTMAGQDLNVGPANFGSHYTAANNYPGLYAPPPAQDAYHLPPGGSAPMGYFAPQGPAPQGAFLQTAIPQVVNPQTVSPQVVNLQVINRQVINPQVVNPQVVAAQRVNPQVVRQQAVIPQAPLQQYPGVIPAKRPRGRPKGARLHCDQPAGDVSAIVRDAWTSAERSYGRMKKAEKRLRAHGRGKEANGGRQGVEDEEEEGEKKRREKCLTKNQRLYGEAVAEYQRVRASEAEGRYDYLPPTRDAEAKLERCRDVLAARVASYSKPAPRRTSPPGQADAAGFVPANDEAREGHVAPFNKAERMWTHSATTAVQRQERIVEKCRERDRLALAVRPLAVPQPLYM